MNPPKDFLPHRTADGSLTLRSAQWDEQYHSVHGAVQESTHVFIRSGLAHFEEISATKDPVDVLEVGLGTGLNLLLTWVRCYEGKCKVNYTALEPFPIDAATLEAMGHSSDLAWPGLHEPFIERMTSIADEWHAAVGGLTFRKRATPVQEFAADAEYDVIYFDAFAPEKQPEMWTLDVFQRMHRALRPQGLLVTYCAKGEVRRMLQAAGFTVERLEGPPGKREMLRARKP